MKTSSYTPSLRTSSPKISWFSAMILSVSLFSLSSCAQEVPELTYDENAAWEHLGLDQKDAFDSSLSQLSSATIYEAPEVGKDYTPPELPDIPFHPEEWTTTTPSTSLANPNAPQGGTLKLSTSAWPPTIRTNGPNSRLGFLSMLHQFVYERLLDWDPQINNYVPGLATHWQIDDDQQTFRFRINPEARWADGRPVTADDIVATFEHLQNPDRKDPSVAQQTSELVEYVKALDSHIVEVKSKEKRWKSFLTIALTDIYPAAYIRMDGETYLNEWNWKLPPGSGPYELKAEDIKKGQQLSLTRRSNYWRNKDPHKKGMYNFSKVQWEIIRDEELMYQKMLAGEIDIYQVTRAQRWVDELDQEKSIQKGWIQKRKVYSLNPDGYSGYCFNMRIEPFNSKNVRKAFSHLFNREKLFEKFFFFQYDYVDSYFPGQQWARKDHKPISFNPEEARALLAADGWTKRDEQGYLTKEDGTRFPTITVEMPSPGFGRIHAVVKEDLWQEAGIELEIKQVEYGALLKKVWEWKYQLVYWGWTASLWPDMEFQFHSKYAGQKQSNNLNGFSNAEADGLMEAYKLEFDPQKRLELMNRLDEIIFEEHPYALGWFAPYYRIIYWDKFGHPPEYSSRYGQDPHDMIMYWWYDKDKAAILQEKKSANISSYPEQKLGQYDEPEFTYWLFNDKPMNKERQ